MEERMYTINEVCKIITLLEEIHKDNKIGFSIQQNFKFYLKYLCETFERKVNAHHRSLLLKACVNAKYRTSDNSLLNELDECHTIPVLKYFHFDRWLGYNLEKFKTVTRDNRKVKILEVLKDDKLDYPIIGIIEGETNKKHWSRIGESKIGEESNDDIFYKSKSYKDLVHIDEDVFKILK